MNNYWWCCKTCFHEFYDSRAVYDHRQATGHVGAALVSNAVQRCAGSTPEGRAKARRIYAEARAAVAALDPKEQTGE